MKKMFLVIILVAGLVLSFGGTAFASIMDLSVTYSLFHLEGGGSTWVQYVPGDVMPVNAGSGDIWKYDYTVANVSENETPNFSNWWHVRFIGEYGIDPQGGPEYAYRSSTAPTGWTSSTEALGEGDPKYPQDYFWVRWETTPGSGLYSPIVQGASQDGFSVEFDYWGADLPGSQHFEGGNGGSESGDTIPVPEPATMLLLGSGLFGLAGFRRKKRS